MFKILFISLLSLLLISFLYAQENFTEMSTQELISIIGYVKKENIKEFRKELKARTTTMSEDEKESYKKNLDKLELKNES